MSLFAISDLHMAGGANKSMDIFGKNWDHHFEKIAQDWLGRVSDSDTVLIPGDISWAMYLKDAADDLNTLGSLPGKKVICRGNHDYWWNSLTQVTAALPQGMFAVQNSAVNIDGRIICGTRGWMIPGKNPQEQTEDTAANEKIFRRELGRLELALTSACKMRTSEEIVVMLHYPPVYSDGEETEFTRLIEKYGAAKVVYGHLHGDGIYAGFSRELNGVSYQLTSCDSLDFKLRLIEK